MATDMVSFSTKIAYIYTYIYSVLTSKARETYTEMSVEQSPDYNTVKEQILKGYTLVLEAFRQKF